MSPRAVGNAGKRVLPASDFFFFREREVTWSAQAPTVQTKTRVVLVHEGLWIAGRRPGDAHLSKGIANTHAVRPPHTQDRYRRNRVYCSANISVGGEKNTQHTCPVPALCANRTCRAPAAKETRGRDCPAAVVDTRHLLQRLASGLPAKHGSL